MSTQPARYPGPVVGHAPGGREQRRVLPAQVAPPVGVPGWVLVAGLAAAAMGVWAYYAFGPDLQRYLKIRSM